MIWASVIVKQHRNHLSNTRCNDDKDPRFGSGALLGDIGADGSNDDAAEAIADTDTDADIGGVMFGCSGVPVTVTVILG